MDLTVGAQLQIFGEMKRGICAKVTFVVQNQRHLLSLKRSSLETKLLGPYRVSIETRVGYGLSTNDTSGDLA